MVDPETVLSSVSRRKNAKVGERTVVVPRSGSLQKFIGFRYELAAAGNCLQSLKLYRDPESCIRRWKEDKWEAGALSVPFPIVKDTANHPVHPVESRINGRAQPIRGVGNRAGVVGRNKLHVAGI